METKHWVVEGINQWAGIWEKWNWYTMTAIQIEFEKEDMAYGYEFIFIVLGVGLHIRFNTDKALEQFDEWTKEIDKELSEKKLIEKRDC